MIGDKARLVSVLPGLQAEGIVVCSAELPEEEDQEDGAGKDVEDAVPNHLGGDGDDVTTLRACPSDRVKEEEKGPVG